MTGCAMFRVHRNRRSDDRVLRAAAPDTDLRHRLCRHRQQYRVHPLARGSAARAARPGLPAAAGARRGRCANPVVDADRLPPAGDDHRPAGRADPRGRTAPGALAARRRIHGARCGARRGRAGRPVHAPVDAPADCDPRADPARTRAMTEAFSPMELALAEAKAAAARGEVPVGAVLVDAEGRVLAAAGNRVEAHRDPTAHAELLALRAGAARRGAKYLDGCDLYVTLEPCAMCAAAIAFARLRRLYFGAYDPKGGAVEHGPRLFQQPTTHHRPEIYGGIEEGRAAELLRAFFRARRDE